MLNVRRVNAMLNLRRINAMLNLRIVQIRSFSSKEISDDEKVARELQNKEKKDGFTNKETDGFKIPRAPTLAEIFRQNKEEKDGFKNKETDGFKNEEKKDGFNNKETDGFKIQDKKTWFTGKDWIKIPRGRQILIEMLSSDQQVLAKKPVEHQEDMVALQQKFHDEFMRIINVYITPFSCPFSLVEVPEKKPVEQEDMVDMQQILHDELKRTMNGRSLDCRYDPMWLEKTKHRAKLRSSLKLESLKLENPKLENPPFLWPTFNYFDLFTDLECVEPIEVEKPTDSFEDVGGLEKQIQELVETIVLPMTTHKEIFQKSKVRPPKGVLLFGPAGTGKTLIARACAAQANASFLKLNGSQLVQMFREDSDNPVRVAFDLARKASPCIIFIDDIDAICAKAVGGLLQMCMMLKLLIQLDDFRSDDDVKVIAATERADILDSALMWPGRLDRKIEFSHPTEEARSRILQIHSRDMNVHPDVNFEELASSTDGFNGAQLQLVCSVAYLIAVATCGHQHFIDAIAGVRAMLKNKNLSRFI